MKKKLEQTTDKKEVTAETINPATEKPAKKRGRKSNKEIFANGNPFANSDISKLNNNTPEQEPDILGSPLEKREYENIPETETPKKDEDKLSAPIKKRTYGTDESENVEANISTDELKDKNETVPENKNTSESKEVKEEKKEEEAKEEKKEEIKPKHVVRLTKTDIQGGSHTLAINHNILLEYLPDEILNPFNELSTFINEFIKFGDVGFLEKIHAKDLEVTTLLKKWISEGNSHANLAPKGKTIDASNIDGMINNLPSVNIPATNYRTNPDNSVSPHNTGNVNVDFMNNNPKNGNPYQHTFNRMKPEFERHSDTGYIEKYAETLHAHIIGTWQHRMWNYIPRDVLNQLLNTSDKAFTYKVVTTEVGTVVNVAVGGASVNTKTFVTK